MAADFEQAYPHLFRCGYRVAYRITGDREASKEIAQESCTRALLRWRKVCTYAEPWTARVAANLALDGVRRRGAAPAPSLVGDDEADAVALRHDLVAALETLSRRQRDVVVGRYLAGMSETEVAAWLSVSVGTVRRHAARGLEALRRRLPNPTQESVPWT